MEIFCNIFWNKIWWKIIKILKCGVFHMPFYNYMMISRENLQKSRVTDITCVFIDNFKVFQTALL